MAISYNAQQTQEELRAMSENLRSTVQTIVEMAETMKQMTANGLQAKESEQIMESFKVKANQMIEKTNELIRQYQEAYKTTADNLIRASQTNDNNVPV